jgi:hypothetical protein
MPRRVGPGRATAARGGGPKQIAANPRASVAAHAAPRLESGPWCRWRSGLWRAAAGPTSLRRVAASNSRSGPRSCLVTSRDPCRRLYTRARANRSGRGSLRLNHQFRMRCLQGNLPAARAFPSYASRTVQLAPCGWLRGGMARDCRGCRHGPVRAVRSRLDPGGGHCGAVEATSGLTTARCSCAVLSGAMVLCGRQLSVAHTQLRLAVLLASRATG